MARLSRIVVPGHQHHGVKKRGLGLFLSRLSRHSFPSERWYTLLAKGGIPMTKRNRFACPCCSFLTLTELPPGTFEICPVCYWEDDNVQFADPEYVGGANRINLV